MAPPMPLAGGPPQVSLHLKAWEPSVRRPAVPFSKTSRSFGPNGGATTVGAAVENLVPRAPKVEPEETQVVEPIAQVAPETEKPVVSDFDREVVSAPITEVAEFSSVGEPQVIESVEEIPVAPKGEPVFAETTAGGASRAPRQGRRRGHFDGRSGSAAPFCRTPLFRATSHIHRASGSAANNTSYHASTEPTNTRSFDSSQPHDRGRSANSSPT